MKNCNTCIYFVKINWNDGRKGLCEATDTTPSKMEGKNCKYYKPKKYDRLSTVAQQRLSAIETDK